MLVVFNAYVRCPEGLAPRANQIYLTRPKDMRVKGKLFVAFLEELNCKNKVC